MTTKIIYRIESRTGGTSKWMINAQNDDPRLEWQENRLQMFRQRYSDQFEFRLVRITTTETQDIIA